MLTKMGRGVSALINQSISISLYLYLLIHSIGRITRVRLSKGTKKMTGWSRMDVLAIYFHKADDYD